MHRHILVVLPHPDDETLATGGTIALHAQAGTPITYLCGTLGEQGRNMGKPTFATRESLPQLREKELREACAILGITDLRLMGLRDKTIEFLDQAEIAARIRQVIDEVNPSLIITYHPQYSVHPDHMALGAATIRAVAEMEPERRPEVQTKAFGKGHETLGKPDGVVDVTSILDVKLAAMRAHRSQTDSMFSRIAARSKEDPAVGEQMEKRRRHEPYWIYRF